MLLISGCEHRVFDKDTGMSRDEIEQKLIKSNAKNRKLPITLQTTPPNLSKLMVAPPPPPMGNGELLSFAVTEEVPIKDVLIELGRLADVDIEVDPNITGGIILKVTNKPLDVVAQRIADLAGLRYTYSNNVLRFEKDEPYTVSYDTDFLIDNEIWSTVETALNDILQLNKSSDENAKEPKLIINKQAGVITIYANQKTQVASTKYIQHIKNNYASQVLIEAKVVEVVLNDSYQAGIDWSFLNSGDGNISFNTNAINQSSLGGVNANITTAIFGGDLAGAINALETFGVTKTLSSPRIHAMNNQKAELKFVNKLIYFSLEKEEEEDNDNNDTKTTYTSTKQEEEVGVTLAITPSINLKKNEITLNVEPELKSKMGEVADPTNELNKVPIIQSKTIQTSLKVKSGNVLVIGGLMSEESNTTDTGIPILSKIPLLGLLFKSRMRTKELKENVIFIKASIIRPNGSVEPYDLDIHNFVDTKNNYFK